jgi:hypothetical protein
MRSVSVIKERLYFEERKGQRAPQKDRTAEKHTAKER